MPSSTVGTIELERKSALTRAQRRAEALFVEVGTRLVRPDITETQLNEEIYRLANQEFGVKRHWHKRVVRAGANTLFPYAENPPDRRIGHDDLVFIDLGPVFEHWEADFGRTFVLGQDPSKLKLCADLGRMFAAGKLYFQQNENVTGRELYDYVCALARKFGWEFGGSIAGHIIGEFPHDKPRSDRALTYIYPGNHTRMRELDDSGRIRHWILEIHLVDRPRKLGGFFEELITIG